VIPEMTRATYAAKGVQSTKKSKMLLRKLVGSFMKDSPFRMLKEKLMLSEDEIPFKDHRGYGRKAH